MNKKQVKSDEAPSPIGPYSQAVKAGNLLFISGQIPMNPSTGEIIQINNYQFTIIKESASKIEEVYLKVLFKDT